MALTLDFTLPSGQKGGDNYQLPHPPLGGSRVDERGGFFVAKTNTIFGQRAQREGKVSTIGIVPTKLEGQSSGQKPGRPRGYPAVSGRQ